MRVLQIGSDRSKRGILYPGSPAFKRQEAYARAFGELDIIAFSLRSDGAHFVEAGPLRVFPTNAVSRLLQAFYAVHIARTVPKPDVISAQDPFETGLVAWLIAGLLRRPLHIQVHTDFLSPEYAKHSTINRVRVTLAGFILRRATRIRVVSERIKISIERRYHLSTPITTLPIFVDVARIRVGLWNHALLKRFSPFSPKLLVVARLEAEKNVALAITVFSKVAPKDACLMIVGEGSLREELSRLAHILKVKHVFFEVGPEVAPYYALADLVLVPSKYEGYGLVIVEALAAGKPVLSTDVGIAREVGAIVAREEQFADALKEWLANGPRTGELKTYPYKDFDEYVHAYCADIEACARGQ